MLQETPHTVTTILLKWWTVLYYIHNI